MRRFISVLLFVLGGWMVMTQLMTAFVDIEPGLADNLLMTAICAVLAVPLLLLGAWASPGRRWHELGLTLLIAAGISTFCGLAMLLVLNDPKFMELMPQPLPDIDLALAFGAVNLMLIAALGWWLYRGRDEARSAD
jgi:cation transport ATPase